MQIIYIIALILIDLLVIIPIIVCLMKKRKEWEEKNKDNILSKKIIFENQKEDCAKTLTEMINFHKNNDTVRYVIK